MDTDVIIFDYVCPNPAVVPSDSPEMTRVPMLELRHATVDERTTLASVELWPLRRNTWTFAEHRKTVLLLPLPGRYNANAMMAWIDNESETLSRIIDGWTVQWDRNGEMFGQLTEDAQHAIDEWEQAAIDTEDDVIYTLGLFESDLRNETSDDEMADMPTDPRWALDVFKEYSGDMFPDPDVTGEQALAALDERRECIGA